MTLDNLSKKTSIIKISLGVACLCWLYAADASADVIDDHHNRATAAATEGQWEVAADELEQALDLLPGRSALLSYNLGTAYAHIGDNGRATFHLRRALQPEAAPSADIAEAARRNLGIVRTRVETAAAASGAQLDPPETSWDLVLTAVRAPSVGVIALVCGWGAFFLWGFRNLRGRTTTSRGIASVAGSIIAVLLVVFVIAGSLHGMSLQTDESSPVAIVLQSQVDVRQAPGQHRKQVFTLQGGSQVRIVERAHGWYQVRLAGGLSGWVPESAVAELHGARRRQRARPATQTDDGTPHTSPS